MKKQEKKIILKGVPASSGIAEGSVKVILNATEISKVKKEDILVTPFTTPLFARAILRSKAIVTDEGGVLCHAAIVSREFGIPCVVGTKKATKILKDDMKIIVDGKEGIVYEK